MWRLLFMIAMLLHSIGHILFLMNTWGYWKTANERAWLFADGLKLGFAISSSAFIFSVDYRSNGAFLTWSIVGAVVWWAMAGAVVLLGRQLPVHRSVMAADAR